jgi:hypothetical protein
MSKFMEMEKRQMRRFRWIDVLRIAGRCGTLEGMASKLIWNEVERYHDAAGLERCVYGLVSGNSVVGVWYCQRFGTRDPSFAKANETMVEAWRGAGYRLFLATVAPTDWAKVVELNEVIRGDLQNHVS